MDRAVVGDGFAYQGNILLPGTVEAVVRRFECVHGGPGELISPAPQSSGRKILQRSRRI